MRRIGFILVLLLLFVSLYSQTSYNMGFSILNYSDDFKFALRSGLKADAFNLDFDLGPNFGQTFSLITITDISAKIWEFDEFIFFDMGLLWTYGRGFPGTLAYGGLNLNFQNILTKLYVGYPFNATDEFLNYFALKVEYTVPKPADFIDDLKFQIRAVNGRFDFSVFLVEPI